MSSNINQFSIITHNVMDKFYNALLKLTKQFSLLVKASDIDVNLFIINSSQLVCLVLLEKLQTN